MTEPASHHLADSLQFHDVPWAWRPVLGGGQGMAMIFEALS